MANIITPRDRDGFEIAIVCALKLERDAVEALMEVDFKEQGRTYGKAGHDRNAYTTGVLGGKAVVLAYPRDMGTLNAATVAGDMRSSFRNIKIGLIVGITGGAPQAPDGTKILLGDVVISTAVIQYDFGRQYPDGFERRKEVESTLGRANTQIANFLTMLGGAKATKRLASKTHQYRCDSTFRTDFAYCDPEKDCLFPPYYRHKHRDPQRCDLCSRCNEWYDPVCADAQKAACTELGCDDNVALYRRIGPSRDASKSDSEPQQAQQAKIFFGRVASANHVMKSGLYRDKLATTEGVIAFEMEGAGTWDQFPTVVVKSVCDYADSHKNKEWQRFAAAIAASCAKAILEEWEVSDHSLAKLDARKPANNIKYDIPFNTRHMRSTDYYVERIEEMQQLESFFQPALPGNGRSIFVVHGMGGMGKTQLCVRFVRKHQNHFSAIFWLDGSSRDALLQSMADAASRVPQLQSAVSTTPSSTGKNVRQSADSLLEWLSLPGNTGWLLVFDNVDLEWQSVPKDSQAYDFHDFLPWADHGSVLVTTRLARLQRPMASLQLRGVDDQLGKDIIEGRAGMALLDVERLLERLGGLPLALVQAGAYIRETNITVSEYCTIYEETWTRLMRHQGLFPLQEYAERSVLTTWKLSYEQVKRVDAPAAKLLDLWAFLYPGDVWYELTSSIAPNTRRDGALERLPMDKLGFLQSVSILSQYSLVTAARNETRHSIHPVVHAWCLHNIETDTERQGMYGLALRLVAAQAKSSEQDPSRDIARRLVPHAHATGQQVQEAGGGEDATVGCERVAYFLQAWESSREVERLYQRALKGKEKAWGPDHTSTLDTVSNLGNLYADQGKMQEAEAMYQRALKGYENAWGPDHTSTLDTVNNLGLLYKDQGKMQEAEAMYRRALKGKEKAWGPDHTSTLNTVNNLGLLYADQGKMREAEAMYQRALKGKEKAWGPDYTSTLDTVHNLGLLYADQGKMQEAEAMYQRALKGYENAWGPDHTSTLDTVHNLGLLYADQGKMQEAEAMYQRALKGYENAWGPDHTSTLDTVHNLGVLYADQGKMQEAEAMYQRALKGKEKAWGPDYTSTLDTVNNLGLLYADQGKMREAEAMYQRALKGYENAWGPDHTSTLDTVHNLGNLYTDQGKMQEAEAMYRRALKGYENA